MCVLGSYVEDSPDGQSALLERWRTRCEMQKWQGWTSGLVRQYLTLVLSSHWPRSFLSFWVKMKTFLFSNVLVVFFNTFVTFFDVLKLFFPSFLSLFPMLWSILFLFIYFIFLHGFVVFLSSICHFFWCLCQFFF